MAMATSRDCDALLQAVSAVARVVRPLYGPLRLRKLVVDSSEGPDPDAGRALFSSDAYVVASALQSHSAASAILQQALDAQYRATGTGCATLLSLCGVLADTVLELRHQGFPIDALRQVLTRTEACCHQTAKRMRLPLNEAFPTFASLSRRRQLEVLGRILSTHEQTHGGSSLATALAVDVACSISPSRFQDEELRVQDFVTSHVLLGGATSTTSSVFPGVLLSIETPYHHSLRRRFPAISEITSVAVIAGDVDLTAFQCIPPVQVAFVHGDVSSQAIDALSNHDVMVCIPVTSHSTLEQLAVMCGAEIIESWEELLPNAIGHERIQLQALDMTVSAATEADEDDPTTFFLQISQAQVRWQLHTSIVFRGPTRSLAVELEKATNKMLWRLRNTLRSGYVVPGNGGFWCACAAVVAHDAQLQQQLEQPALLGELLGRLSAPLRRLAVLLLENSQSADASSQQHSFFSRLEVAQTVQKRFERGLRDVGAKFFSHYDFQNADYAVLRFQAPEEPENEDGRRFHADELSTLQFSIRSAFRVLQLLLSVERYTIN